MKSQKNIKNSNLDQKLIKGFYQKSLNEYKYLDKRLSEEEDGKLDDTIPSSVDSDALSTDSDISKAQYNEGSPQPTKRATSIFNMLRQTTKKSERRRAQRYNQDDQDEIRRQITNLLNSQKSNLLSEGVYQGRRVSLDSRTKAILEPQRRNSRQMMSKSHKTKSREIHLSQVSTSPIKREQNQDYEQSQDGSSSSSASVIEEFSGQ